MADLLFRDATHDDIATILTLGHAGDSRGAAAPPLDPATLSDPRYRVALDEIDADPAHRLIVVEHNGEIIGTLQISIIPGLPQFGLKRGLLEHVHIRADQRGTGYGSAMMKILTDKAKELSVQFYLRSPVTKILKKDGRISGVIAEDISGETVQANSRAVIINAGGFSDNPEMVKKYTGYDLDRNLFGIRVPGVTGDGLRDMAGPVAFVPKVTAARKGDEELDFNTIILLHEYAHHFT